MWRKTSNPIHMAMWNYYFQLEDDGVRNYFFRKNAGYCYSWSCAVRYSSGNSPLIWRFRVTCWARFYSSLGSCGSMLPQEPESSGLCFFIQRKFGYSSTHHACSLSKSHRKICVIVPEKRHRSLWPREISLCVFSTLIKSLLYLSQYRMGLQKQCTPELLEKYQYLPHNEEKRKQPQETDFLKDLASTWTSWNDCHLPTLQLPHTVSSLQPSVPPFHIMQHRVAKALL